MLDILTFLEFKADDFEFNVYTEGTKLNLNGKIVFNITLLAISYISCIQFKSVLVSFFFFWYFGYLVFRFAVLFKHTIPAFLQPFPYCCLSLFSVVVFLITLVYEENTFRPPSLPITLFPRIDHHKAPPVNKTSGIFSFYHSSNLNPDFSLMSYTTCLILFEISIFLYAFALFYGVGKETVDMSHSELIVLRRNKMRSYYETVLIDMSSC